MRHQLLFSHPRAGGKSSGFKLDFCGLQNYELEHFFVALYFASFQSLRLKIFYRS